MQVNKNTSFKYCYPFPEEWGPEYAKAVVLAKFLVYYAIPLVIIGLFYIMIAIHLAYGASVPGEMQGAMRQVSVPHHTQTHTLIENEWTIFVYMVFVSNGPISAR